MVMVEVVGNSLNRPKQFGLSLSSHPGVAPHLGVSVLSSGCSWLSLHCALHRLTCTAASYQLFRPHLPAASET